MRWFWVTAERWHHLQLQHLCSLWPGPFRSPIRSPVVLLLSLISALCGSSVEPGPLCCMTHEYEQVAEAVCNFFLRLIWPYICSPPTLSFCAREHMEQGITRHAQKSLFTYTQISHADLIHTSSRTRYCTCAIFSHYVKKALKIVMVFL